MKISLTPTEIGFEIRFTNDPKIEQFFKETSLKQYNSYLNYSSYVVMNLSNYPLKFIYAFVNRNSFYYNDHPIISLLTIVDSSKMEIKTTIKGLVNAEKFVNDFSNFTNEFIKEVIKPYYMTKRFIENKDSKLVENNVINKEGYSKNWYSYYRNYKKYIHDFNEGLLAK